MWGLFPRGWRCCVFFTGGPGCSKRKGGCGSVHRACAANLSNVFDGKQGGCCYTCAGCWWSCYAISIKANPRKEYRRRCRQRALQEGPARRRRKRASLYQPAALRTANKAAAAAVLLSVNRLGQRTTEQRAAPRQTISKRSDVAGVTEGEGLEKVATPTATWVEEKILFGYAQLVRLGPKIDRTCDLVPPYTEGLEGAPAREPATRSRAPNGAQRTRHRAGYRSPDSQKFVRLSLRLAFEMAFER
jgi:hypothetical protein